MKLCKDCTHCNYVWAGLIQCEKQPVSVSIYDGSLFYDPIASVRFDESRCGAEGKWFVANHDPSVEVYTDERTLRVVNSLLVGTSYETVDSGEGHETLRFIRNGSVYDLTYDGPTPTIVTITPV